MTRNPREIDSEEFFRECAAKANIPEALAILARAGVGNPPMPGDELPAPSPKRRAPKKKTS